MSSGPTSPPVAREAGPAPVDAAAMAARLRSAAEVTVLCHVHPDGDAIGSATALGAALAATGVLVHVSFDPGVVSSGLAGIPGAKAVVPLAEVPAHGGTVVVVDCADAGRPGDWARLAEAAGEVLVIDHHASNPGFGHSMLLDPSAPSTASLVLEVLEAGDYTVTPDVATALYAGLVTDTGSFRWGGAGAHATASRLLEAGADADRMTFDLLDSRPFGWLGVLGGILDSATLEPEAAGGAGAVWAVVDHACTRRAAPGDVESVVTELRGVREADVAVVCKEFRPGTWSVSLRSRGAVDVSAVAAALGGGGHHAAAGVTVAGTGDEVAGRVRDLLG